MQRTLSKIDRYIGQYLGFTDRLVLAKITDFISLSRCWQNAVMFLMHVDNLQKKAQQTKSRHLSCSHARTCVIINKQTRTMECMSTITAETKASSFIRLIKIHVKYW